MVVSTLVFVYQLTFLFILDLSKPFIKVCPDVNVVEFQTISFTCHAKGFPTLTYDWANDGVTFQKNVSEVSLLNVTRKKAGSYECIVSNGAGKSETKNISVNIQCRFMFVTLCSNL